MRATEATVVQGVLPVNLGGSAKTADIAEAIIKNLKSAKGK